MQNMIYYYLLTEVLEDQSQTYGIMVEYLGEETAISEISTFRERIELLLEILRRGSVTPVATRDVIDDWLCD